jgi:hypothetical protein
MIALAAATVSGWAWHVDQYLKIYSRFIPDYSDAAGSKTGGNVHFAWFHGTFCFMPLSQLGTSLGQHIRLPDKGA